MSSPSTSSGFTAALRLIAVLAIGLAVGMWGGLRHSGASPATWSAESLSSRFHRVAMDVSPAVVNVRVEAESPGAKAAPPEKSNKSLEQYFKIFPPLPHSERSEGSGIILDPSGLILTNRHVIEGADQVQVVLAGQEQPIPATLVGEDAESDLAVLRIHVNNPLPVAHWGNSSNLQVGDWVLAVGSPFGLRQSVTAGIVSAMDRHIPAEHNLQGFIQTDAPINPGNSGGPLVDLRGGVVGINTAIYTESNGSQGVGFALPATVAKSVFQQIVRYGRVRRGSIGVYFEPMLSPSVRRVYHLQAGVPVAEVQTGGPAQKAGLKDGDIITAVNGRSLEDGSDLVHDIVNRQVGSTLQLQYLRDGQLHNAEVTVADRDSLFHKQPPFQPVHTSSAPLLGLEIKSIDSTVQKKLDLPNQEGVLVRSVTPGSFADNIGVQRGDVILAVNRVPVKGAPVYRQVLKSLRPGQDIAFALRRLSPDGHWTRWFAGGSYLQ